MQCTWPDHSLNDSTIVLHNPHTAEQLYPGFLHQKYYKFKAFSFNSPRPFFQSIILLHTSVLVLMIKRHKLIWGTHAGHLLIKHSKQFFYQLYSNYDRKFAQSNRQFQTFQGLPHFFQNNSRTFSVFWNSTTCHRWPWIQGRRRNPAFLISFITSAHTHTQTHRHPHTHTAAPLKVKVHTLDIAPICSESPPQKCSGMAHVLNQSINCDF